MKSRWRALVAMVIVPVLGSVALGVPRDPEADFKKAREAYLKHDLPKAEKYFRELTKSAPDYVMGHIYLGHRLYYQQRFKEAIPEYERAMELAPKAPEPLQPLEERILTDQLGMSYAASGRLDKAKTLFESAVKKDPDFPMYYYNLACTYAEMGDLDQALVNLRLGFDRKGNSLPGESYPDPRTDDSFKRYLGDERFQRAMKEMGVER